MLRSNRSRLLGVVFGVQHAFHADLRRRPLHGGRAASATSWRSARSPRPATSGRPWPACCTTAARRSILLGPHAPRPSWPRSPRGCRSSSSPARSGTAPWTSSAPPTATGMRQAVDHLVGAGPPADRARRRRPRARRGRAPPRLPRRHAPPRARRQPLVPGGPHRGRRRRGRRARCSTATRARPPSPCSTTAAPSACSTSCTAPASTSPATSAWSATTTAASPGCPHRPDHRRPGHRALTTLAVHRAVDRLDGPPVTRREQIVRRSSSSARRRQRRPPEVSGAVPPSCCGPRVAGAAPPRSPRCGHRRAAPAPGRRPARPARPPAG